MNDPENKSVSDVAIDGAEHDKPGSPRKPLPPAAQRALAEAAERRRLAEAAQNAHPAAKEFNGPTGPEPTRYGDWERKGIASDF